MKIDLTKLDEGLEKLRGLDLLELEREERLTGNNVLELTTSKSFQARVAAKALNMNVHDLKELPLRTFNQICLRCFSFLNEPDESLT